jgi:lycopene beta-cyclase
MVEVVIAGGGLAGSLAAWRLATTRRDVRVRLFERGASLGGNHTWSFHDTDIPGTSRAWLEPLVIARWASHVVHFPGGSRTLPGAYASISSERLHAVIAAVLADRIRFGAEIARVEPDRLLLASGEEVRASVVIDARGDVPVNVPLGWQTFLGQELECERDHGVMLPTIMDATVAQDNGYRFVYVLPFGPRTLLVEDTCYADHPVVDVPAARGAIARYIAAHGWPAHRVAREEIGSLPLPLGGSAEAFWPDAQPRIGLRAGLFHPTTGYSLPDAVATADLLSRLALGDAVQTAAALRDFSVARWRARGFFRMLNRLLFRAARPDERVRVLEQFYRRPADVIARFYAANLTRTDRVRLMAGRPPVSVLRAVAHMREPRMIG